MEKSDVEFFSKMNKWSKALWISSIVSFGVYFLLLIFISVGFGAVSFADGIYYAAKYSWLGYIFLIPPFACLLIGIIFCCVKFQSALNVILGTAACLFVCIFIGLGSTYFNDFYSEMDKNTSPLFFGESGLRSYDDLDIEVIRYKSPVEVDVKKANEYVYIYVLKFATQTDYDLYIERCYPHTIFDGVNIHRYYKDAIPSIIKTETKGFDALMIDQTTTEYRNRARLCVTAFSRKNRCIIQYCYYTKVFPV